MSCPSPSSLGTGILTQITYQLLAGAFIGLAIARGGQWVLARAALPVAGLYPLATLALALLGYATASLASASGIIAAYLGGIVLGNSPLPHRRATLAFAEGCAGLAQIGLFVLLGLLASPDRLDDALLPALLAGFVLTFIARPVSIFVCARPFGIGNREAAFVSWAGLRGAVPIVLTTVPVAAGVDGSLRVFDIVFLLVVAFTLIQGPTLGWAARLAGVAGDLHATDVEVESAPLDEAGADLLEVTIPVGSRLAGVWEADLRLPVGAALALVVRDGVATPPGPDTVLRAGDRLILVTPRQVREATVDRLHAVGRSGRLAGWLEPKGSGV